MFVIRSSQSICSAYRNDGFSTILSRKYLGMHATCLAVYARSRWHLHGPQMILMITKDVAKIEANVANCLPKCTFKVARASRKIFADGKIKTTASTLPSDRKKRIAAALNVYNVLISNPVSSEPQQPQ